MAGDASQIEGMVTLTRHILGVSAHLGNSPLEVFAEDQHLSVLRRSMYTTATGLLMFSQGDLQEAIEEPDTSGKRPFFERVANGWSTFNDKLKSFF